MKNILITGCSKSIGYSAATILHQKGYQVIATVRKREDAQTLETQGITCTLLDLADSESILSAFNFVCEQFNGRIYVLFNNGAF